MSARRLASAALVLLATSALGPGCDSESKTPADASRRVTFTPCEGDYECATVEVPVDYADPSGAKIAIALLRAPAKDPAARLGSVVINPGGPGLAFVDRLATTYPVLSAAFSEATSRFDVVAFDWRGVGRSNPIGCGDDALVDRVRSADLTLQKAGSLAEVAAVRASVGACLAKGDQKLLGQMNTENAARDLDRIREALGEEKLNYLAFSYGTWLGATYATLFPERVRAFALDSATVLEVDLDAEITEQSASYEMGLQRFFEACARDATCALRGAGASAADPAAVAARFDALTERLKTGPGILAGARTATLVDLQFTISDALRSGKFLDLAAALASAEAGDGKTLTERGDLVAGRRPDATYDTTLLGLLAIACVDQPLGAAHTLEAFQGLATTTRARHPRGTSPALLPWSLCTDWPYRRAGPRLAIHAPTAAKALVIAGRYDPITSYAQGPALVAALANGSSLLTYEGDGHGAALHSACVREIVTAFFVDPTRAPVKTTCPAE